MKEYLIKLSVKFLKYYSLAISIIIIGTCFYINGKGFRISFNNVCIGMANILFHFGLPLFIVKSKILVAIIYLSPYSLLFLLKTNLSPAQLQALINLDLGLKIQKKGKDSPEFVYPKIKKYKDHIKVISPNLIIKLEDIMKNKESFESIFNSTFADIKKTKGTKQQFHFYYDFFSTVNANEFNPPPEYSVYFGKTNQGQELVLSLRDVFSGHISGISGAGKTSLLQNYFQIMKAVDPEFSIVIFDAKGLDFDLEWLEKYKIKYFFMGSTEELEIARDYLEALRFNLITDEKKLLNEQRVKHTEDLRKLGISSKRYLLLFDEATQFLCSKGGSKEFINVKKQLIDLVEKFLAMGRAYGVATWISTQRLEQDELDVSTSNIRFRLINGVESDEMRRKYTQGQVGPEPVLSRWYIRCDSYKGFIKTPFLSEEAYLKSSPDRPEGQD